MNPTLDASGNKYWHNQYGQLHRLDGPAIEWKNGNRSWFINGRRHREDGPAIKLKNGKKAWFLFDKEYSTKEEWKEALKEYYHSIGKKTPQEIAEEQKAAEIKQKIEELLDKNQFENIEL